MPNGLPLTNEFLEFTKQAAILFGCIFVMLVAFLGSLIVLGKIAERLFDLIERASSTAVISWRNCRPTPKADFMTLTDRFGQHVLEAEHGD